MKKALFVVVMVFVLGALAFAQDIIRYEYTSDNVLDVGMVVKIDHTGNNKIAPCTAAGDTVLGVIIAYADKGGTRVYAVANSGNGLAVLPTSVTEGTPLTWDNSGYLVPIGDASAVGNTQVAVATEDGLGSGAYSRIMITIGGEAAEEVCCRIYHDDTPYSAAISDTSWTTIASWNVSVECPFGDAVPVAVLLNAEVSDTGLWGAVDSIRLYVNSDVSNADARQVILVDQDYHGTDNFDLHTVENLVPGSTYSVTLQVKVAHPKYTGGIIKVRHLEAKYCKEE